MRPALVCCGDGACEQTRLPLQVKLDTIATFNYGSPSAIYPPQSSTGHPNPVPSFPSGAMQGTQSPSLFVDPQIVQTMGASMMLLSFSFTSIRPPPFRGAPALIIECAGCAAQWWPPGARPAMNLYSGAFYAARAARFVDSHAVVYREYLVARSTSSFTFSFIQVASTPRGL